MRKVVLKIISKVCTVIALRNVSHGKNCRCNFPCRITQQTTMGENCNFNGIKISGEGKVVIGNNFHSGKNIRVLTTFHNWNGKALPYDDTYYSKDVYIGDNVWIGEGVMILGGVTIGEGSIVQAGSVVCRNIPPLAIAGGHPAVPFKFRDQVHYQKLKNPDEYEDK